MAVSWRLRGMLLLNVTSALCIAPASNQFLPLMTRCENAVCGFLLIDLWQMASEVMAIRHGLSKKSTFMAPQTASNLQQVCLSIIGIALSKPAHGDYWSAGPNRVGEISIEQFFGRIRSQSNTAQVTARGYWRAMAREAIVQQLRRSQKEKEEYKVAELPALTPNDFREACENALRSSLALVSSCTKLSSSVLEDRYREACRRGDLGRFDLAALAPHPVEMDEEDLEQEDVAASCENLLKVIQDDSAKAAAAMEEEQVNLAEGPDTETEKDAMEFDDLPDAEELKQAMAPEPSESAEAQQPKHLPLTLKEALELHNNGRSLWDSLWRLSVSLRHGHLNCSRTIQFISIQFNSIQFNSVLFCSILMFHVWFHSVPYCSIMFRTIRYDSHRFRVFSRCFIGRKLLTLRKHKGCDSHWIPNPVSCRVASKKLSWHQLLA